LLNANEEFNEEDGEESHNKLPPFKEKPAKAVGFTQAGLKFLLNPLANVVKTSSNVSGMNTPQPQSARKGAVGVGSPGGAPVGGGGGGGGGGGRARICPLNWLSEEAWEMAGALSQLEG
jgi:hypothetical protein